MVNKDEEIKKYDLSAWENDILKEFDLFSVETLLDFIKDEDREAFLINLADSLFSFKEKTREQERERILDIFKEFQKEMLKHKINVEIVFKISKLVREKYNIDIPSDSLSWNERLRKARKELEE